MHKFLEISESFKQRKKIKPRTKKYYEKSGPAYTHIHKTALKETFSYWANCYNV